MSRHSDALLDAVVIALEAEAVEPDPEKRLVILRATRSTLEAWKRERVTTEEAISMLLGVRPNAPGKDAPIETVRDGDRLASKRG
jgi:hypothetical protein